MSSVEAHRRFYANFVVRSVGSIDERLIAVFSTIEREHFLGPGPWSVRVRGGYTSTISNDPCIVYQDIVVGLAIDRGINNGQPTLHARCLAACAPKVGDAVVQVGVGTGYYTALLATLVSATGHVAAYEIEADLAEQARVNLQAFPNVVVINASASEGTLPAADVVYVSAGATHPLAAWLDALKIGGRLVFPLTPDEGLGVMMLVTRGGEATYAASVLMPVAFIPCIGARDTVHAEAVAVAVNTRSIMATQSLLRGTVPDGTACCVGDGWWLSSAAAS